MFEGPFDESIIKRAKQKRKVKIKIHNLRKWANDKRNTVDDRQYGGGAGMVLRVDIIDRALKSLKPKLFNKDKTKVVLLSPQGKRYCQEDALKFSKFKQLILISGHYEGFDERIRKHLVDEEISIGDFVLTGGEIPTMAVVDSVVRLIPGVLGNEQSLEDETFSKKDFVKYPVYTRPENYKGWKVPEVLLSGNHNEIKKWRDKNSKKKS